MNRRVWFHRARAAGWIIAGAAALIWWRDSIVFVIVASVYANVISDWTAAEAADDSAVLERLKHIEAKIGSREQDRPPWP